MCQNYLAIFLSIHISFQGNRQLNSNPTKMFCDRHQVNEKGCSLAALGGDKPLDFFSKKKKCYWVRNIATLDKNILTREITWTSCYII